MLFTGTFFEAGVHPHWFSEISNCNRKRMRWNLYLEVDSGIIITTIVNTGVFRAPAFVRGWTFPRDFTRNSEHRQKTYDHISNFVLLFLSSNCSLIWNRPPGYHFVEFCRTFRVLKTIYIWRNIRVPREIFYLEEADKGRSKDHCTRGQNYGSFWFYTGINIRKLREAENKHLQCRIEAWFLLYPRTFSSLQHSSSSSS